MPNSLNTPDEFTDFGSIADDVGGQKNCAASKPPSSSPDPDANVSARRDQDGAHVDYTTSEDLEGTDHGAPTLSDGFARYRVGFYNETADSTGHDHHVCQRSVEVMGLSADQAIASAIAEFEKCEGVSTWRNRAHSIELTRTAD